MQCDNYVLNLDFFQPSLLTNLGQQTDHSLRTFLELLTTQQFLNKLYFFIFKFWDVFLYFFFKKS